jgi:hypothetical protein
MSHRAENDIVRMVFYRIDIVPKIMQMRNRWLQLASVTVKEELTVAVWRGDNQDDMFRRSSLEK